MLEGKKGVSPLVATFLLILFSIALGAVVMTWGRSYVEGAAAVAEQKTESVSCDFDASVGIRKVSGESRVCYSNGAIQFLIENTGIVDVRGITVQVIGRDIYKMDLSDVNLRRADVKAASINYPSSVGTPAQIQITPNYYANNQLVCPKNVLIVENIKQC